MAKEKQTIKRLPFTDDVVEQALLAAAEARIDAGDFPDFAELCKTALQTFLNPPSVSSQPIMAGSTAVEARLAQIEQTLAGLQTGQQTLHTLLEQSVSPTTTPATPQTGPILANNTPETHGTAVSQATVSRLARFLEDF